jgi:putative FmdB family regulatory protein
MPIYEYQCDKCGEVFEVFQKVSDPPPKTHSCGSDKLHRVMSQTSFILKGTGWYVTDYARKGQSSEEKTRKRADHKTNGSSDVGNKSSGETKAPGDTKTSNEAKSSGERAA